MTNALERWVPIIDYEGLYEVSDLGRVRSLRRSGTGGRIRVPRLNSRGYYCVSLSRQNHGCAFCIHVLVYENFNCCSRMPQAEIDHINRIPTDNRLENLRVGWRSEGNANQGKRKGTSSSRFKGVHWNKQKQKWYARNWVNGKVKYLGSFANEEDAGRAYDRAAIEAWGEFAATNGSLGLYEPI